MKKLNLFILSLFLLSTKNVFADDIVSFKGADDYVEGEKISVTFYPSLFSAKKYPTGYVDASLDVKGKAISQSLPFKSGTPPQTLTYTIQRKDVSRGYILINVFYMATPQGPTIRSFSKTLTKKKSQADYERNLKELVDGAKYDNSARHNYKEKVNTYEELRQYVGPSHRTRSE